MLPKHGHERDSWQVVADEAGRIVGRYWIPKKAYALEGLEGDIRTIKNFLLQMKGCQMSKNQSDSTERVNMVWLAGVLKFDPQNFDNAVKALIDTGQKQAIQVGAMKNKDGNTGVAEKLARFLKGDYIKVVCILEAYGVKQDDNSWKNGLAVRITEIKNDPPRRAEMSPARTDDDMPF